MLFGLLIPLLGRKSMSAIELLLILLIMAFVSSATIGIGWYIDIARTKLSKDSDLLAIERAIGSNNKWLQILVPRSHNFQNVSFDGSRKGNFIASTFLSSFVFGLAILAVGGILAIQLHDQDGRGVFGALLNFTIGKSISLAFSLYLLISCLAVLVVGLIFKFTSWRNQ